MRLRLTALLLLLCLVPAARAQPYVPGQTYFGTNSYIEYQAGDTPIIITAPHGGNLTPAAIPTRANGTYNGVTYTDIVTGADLNTEDLARRVAAEIFARTGRRAHLAIVRLARSKLDANREIGEAALGNATAETAWREYHGFIQAARAAAEREFGFGFVIDLHGHGHTIQRLELGYNYDAELDQSDTALNHPGYALQGTLHTLLLRRPGLPFATLLRGAGSLGDLFTRRGLPAWPGPDFPTPGAEEFFDGGYTVLTHSCILDNGPVTGVQIECNYTGVRDSISARTNFAEELTRVLHIFLYNHYGYALNAYSVSRLLPPSTATLVRGGAPLTLTVERTGNLALSSNLALSFGGTATIDTDFTTSATSLNFAANQATASFTLTPAGSPDTSGDRNLTVALAPTATQTADRTPLRLILGDGVSQTVRVTSPVARVSESARTATFRLTRTFAGSPLTVPLTWSGTARPEADYFDAPASITFPANATAVDVSLPLVDDGRPEANQTLVAQLGSGAGYVVGADASATLELIDDDRPAGLAVWLRGELSANVALDSSGQGRHGTALPADAADVAGPTVTTFNGRPAFAFDGTDDTLVLPRFAADAQGALSLAFFFRLQIHPSGNASNHTLLSYGGPRGNPGTLHIYTSSSTNLRTSIGGILLDVTQSSPGWQDNVWRHYALSIAADGTARVYLDGTLRRTQAVTPGLMADQLFWLGWRAIAGAGSTSLASFMRGGLADFRLYQRALDAPEIAALAAQSQNYSAWLAQNALPSSLAATSDADANGLAALVEYALGSPPARPEAPPRYTVTTENDRLTLRFLREAGASDLTWRIQASADLVTWQTLASRTAAAAQWTIAVAGAAVTEQNGFVTATDAVVTPANGGRFLRLQVER